MLTGLVFPLIDGGLALSCGPRAYVGVVTRVKEAKAGLTIEFRLVFGAVWTWDEPAFLDARVEVPPLPIGMDAPEPRFRFLITSVFKDNGRTTP